MKAVNPSFDRQTAKKLLTEYADKIVFYMKENQDLRNQLDQMKITLDINKEMLYNYVYKNCPTGKKEIICKLQSENKRIDQVNITLYTEINDKGKKLYQLEQQLNEKTAKYQNIIDEKQESNFLLQNKLAEKDSLIKQMNKDLNDIYHSHFHSTKKVLHILTDPSQANIELNQELEISREMIVNYSHLMNHASRKEKEQAEKIKELNDTLINLKKGRKIKKNIQTIETLGYLITEESNEDNLFEINLPNNMNKTQQSNRNSTIQSINDTNNNKNSNSSNYNNKNRRNLFRTPNRKPLKSQESPLTTSNNQKLNKSAMIPRLDLSPIINKYTPFKKNDIKVKDKKSSSSDDEYLDKLKYELATSQYEIIKYKKKIAKLKKIITVLKNLYLTTKTVNQHSSTGTAATGSTSDDKKSSTFHSRDINIDDSIRNKQYNKAIEGSDGKSRESSLFNCRISHIGSNKRKSPY